MENFETTPKSKEAEENNEERMSPKEIADFMKKVKSGENHMSNVVSAEILRNLADEGEDRNNEYIMTHAEDIGLALGRIFKSSDWKEADLAGLIKGFTHYYGELKDSGDKMIKEYLQPIIDEKKKNYLR